MAFLKLTVGASAVAAAFASSDTRTGGYVRSKHHFAEHVLSPRPHEVAGFNFEDLPTGFDWRTHETTLQTSLVTITRNQHVPNCKWCCPRPLLIQPRANPSTVCCLSWLLTLPRPPTRNTDCGACWAFATTSTLADRYRIMTKGTFPQSDLSMQVLLNCDTDDNGCHGGDYAGAHKYIHDAGGIPDETCQSYEATGHDQGNTCTDADVCRNCDPKLGCSATPTFPVWAIDEYGTVNGTTAMKAEISARGPIACAIAVTADLVAFKGRTDVFVDSTGTTELDHAIQVAGWGMDESSREYWVVRNSWGTHWGDQGSPV